jgi:hypothetical protein
MITVLLLCRWILVSSSLYIRPPAYPVENFVNELVADILEKQAFATASRLETQIERGEGRAAILDSAPSSSSSPRYS